MVLQLPHHFVIKTDGGPHPSDKWAEATANEIANLVEVDDNSSTDEAKLARRAKPQLALNLAAVLDATHAAVTEDEKDRLGNGGSLLAPAGTTDQTDGALKDVLAATDKTPWPDHFRKPEVTAHVRKIIDEDLQGNVHVARSWHVDQLLATDPTHEGALAWRKRWHGK